VIRIQAVDFPQFLAAFGLLRGAGVDLIAAGGNEMSVPDDTDLGLLRAVAAVGATVHTDLAGTAEEPDDSGDSDEGKPARKPRKTTTRRTSKE
jgi:hypothetical protein